MLPLSHRLPAPDVRQVMRSGRRLTSPELVLIYRKRELKFATTKRTSELSREAGPWCSARFAVVVPKRVDKRAVVRNRTKRLVREALRKLLPTMDQGIDGVIIVRKKLETLEEAEQILVRACRTLLY